MFFFLQSHYISTKHCCTNIKILSSLITSPQIKSTTTIYLLHTDELEDVCGEEAAAYTINNSFITFHQSNKP